MKKEEVHVALGLPPPPADEANDPYEGADDGANPTDQEKAEDDAIDAVFETRDPEERREAFRTAVRLCAKSY